MLVCCVTVKLSSGKVKTYDRHVVGSLSYVLQVCKVTVAYMQKRLEIEGSPTKVLGGWIREEDAVEYMNRTTEPLRRRMREISGEG